MSIKDNLDYEWIRFAQNVNLFVTGALDATLAMSYNEYYQLLQAGMEIGDECVYRFCDHGYNVQEDGVYMTRDYYLGHRDLAGRFAEASRRGWEWAAEHPEETLDIVMEYVDREHITTNRVMQRLMLEDVLRLQVDRESGQRDFRLRPDMVKLASSLMAEYTYESQIVAKELSFLKGNTSISISGKVYNAGAEGFTGIIACVLQNMETGDITVLKKTDEMTIKPIVNGTYWLQSISLFANSVSSVSDGTYRLYVASRTAEDTQWQLVRPLEGQVNNFIVTKSPDGVTWQESTDDLWSLNVATAIQSPVTTQSDASVRYFDLQGREVPSTAKGLLIRKQNNEVKKVMMK